MENVGVIGTIMAALIGGGGIVWAFMVKQSDYKDKKIEEFEKLWKLQQEEQEATINAQNAVITAQNATINELSIKVARLEARQEVEGSLVVLIKEVNSKLDLVVKKKAK